MIAARDRLIDKVLKGKTTPEKAEAIAVKKGFGPLASHPKPQAFDPLRELWWTPLMALAWIIWRRPDGVCQCWDAYRSECWGWLPIEGRVGVSGPVFKGHQLTNLGLATLLTLDLRAVSNSGGIGFLSVSEAKEHLQRALTSGGVETSGISRRTGKRSTIHRTSWIDVSVNLIGEDTLPNFDALRVSSADVIEQWPPGDDAEKRRPGRPSSMHLVKAEFQRRCAEGSVSSSLANEVDHLHRWLGRTYEDEAPLSAKTITNRLRNDYKAWKEKDPKLK